MTVTEEPTPTKDSGGGGGGSSLPKPPSGSKELSSRSSGGSHYARYKNPDMTPAKVVSAYKSEAESAGYSIKQSGGSGGGWGGYGGSEAGMTAVKSDSFLGVQAGGSRQGATYFEVCVGGDKSALRVCDHHSDRDSRSSGS